MGTRIAALIVKELLAVLRDPRARMVLIGPPILQLLIFAFAVTLEVKEARIAILDQDRGPWAYEMIQRLQGSPTFTDLVFLDSVENIRPTIDNQDAIAVVHFPQSFSGDIAAGRGTTVQLVFDGRRSNAAQIVQGYIARIVQTLNADIAMRQGRAQAPSTLVMRSWFNPNLDYHWFTVPSLIGIIGLLLGISVTALSVAREKELGTFEQLLVSPLQPVEILIGKTVPTLLIGLFNGTIFLLIGHFAFAIPFTGSLWLLYGALVVYLIAVIGIGLFISTLARTQQQAFLGAFVFAAPAILLSGFATPVENMPEWLQDFTMINPLRHFLVIVNGLFTKDMPLETVARNAWPLLAIALVTISLSSWLFRKRLN